MIFKFSNESDKLSQNTSLDTTKRMVDIFYHSKTSLEKEKIVEELHYIIRKLAHYTLYTIGGILLMNYINTYNIGKEKKTLYSISIGIIYACTDEFHQIFVEGRSCQLSDVLIDSIGVLTGICIFLCVIKIISLINNKKEGNKVEKNN